MGPFAASGIAALARPAAGTGWTLPLMVITLLPVLLAAAPAMAQVAERLEASPAAVTVAAGETVRLTVQAFDAGGNPIDADLQLFGAREGVRIEADRILGLQAGEYEIVAATVEEGGREPISLRIPVVVTWPPIARIEIEAQPGQLLEGTRLTHSARAFHANGTERPSARIQWSVSEPSVASVDRFGTVTAHARGDVTVIARFDGGEATRRYSVGAFQATRLELEATAEEARTGDVVHFEARLLDAQGREVTGAPVTWTHRYTPPDSIVAPAGTGVLAPGRFVADVPGFHTVMASSGPLSAEHTVEVTRRDVVQRILEMGQGSTNHRRTSDFWVYEGVDGRDYAVTGTWGSGGFAYFWDVTDPTSVILTDSIQVDARTVNDVKVSPDGRYAVLTREGASDRRNGVVIMDLSNPRHPVLAATYTEGLTGGVHNTFPTDDYLFALSGGEKYVILDMRDIYNPRYVSEYRHPNGRIHDVWVMDGIAYSAQWDAGVVVVDVGNGGWGGTIENPVFINNLPVPGGRTHELIPYFQESTGRMLLFLGDEIIGRPGHALEGGNDRAPFNPDVPGSGRPRSTAGYMHIVDFTDPENPKKIARYHVPDYGTHNAWVEDDILYQAYYEGGLRVVDISGDLMGNLYTQGREIAVFKPYDPEGYQRNAPMVWSAQLHKGHVFLSDANSGLWSLKLEPRERSMVP
ncbi:MAG: hypothetical protein EA350_06790 [Gemmatimonadales bacterium]|nr:MAG: hypothetical protein EA350_06790 [Gemmatimonadales bacterium]